MSSLMSFSVFIQKQLSEFDGLTSDLVTAARSDTGRDLDINQTYEKLHLREAQLKVHNYCRSLFPSLKYQSQVVWMLLLNFYDHFWAKSSIRKS